MPRSGYVRVEYTWKQVRVGFKRVAKRIQEYEDVSLDIIFTIYYLLTPSLFRLRRKLLVIV
jgi:hypothetical protein